MTLQSAARHRQLIQELADDPQHWLGVLQDQTGGDMLPPAVTGWLVNLGLLIGVPFNYLVPDERMLPAESIRVFSLDPNWIAALLDGAMSIGRTSTIDASHDDAVAPLVHAAVNTRLGSVRARALAADPPPPAPTGPVTGFLMRSQLVADTPGLQVAAYDTSGQSPLPILRLELLSPSVLLGLFTGTAVRFEISEPGHLLRLGVVVSATSPPTFTLPVRDLGLTGGGIGDPLPNAQPAAVPFRASDQSARVLDVCGLVSNIENSLKGANLLPEGSSVDAGALAIQLLQPPARQDYAYRATTVADSPAAAPPRVPLPDELRAAGRAALDAYLRESAR
jgi:hypothetical protein